MSILERSMLTLAVLTSVAGCATSDQAPATREPAEMVTGSNIPRRDRPRSEVIVVNPQAVIDTINHTGAVSPTK